MLNYDFYKLIKLFTSFSSLFFLKGNDPRKNTNFNIDTNHSVRGKLQTRRCKLNKEINKELRLRAGAENLFKVRFGPKQFFTIPQK